jgi:D-alanine--poly(phosphoribitol) ligase subunit 2
MAATEAPDKDVMSIPDEVVAALIAVTQEPGIGASQDIDLFGEQILDSLRTIELVVELSERLQIDIALSEIDRVNWATPHKIIDFIEHRLDR